ncbi:hypothetical protein SAMN05421771_1840 [Granulicella pectinivorans]|jgi:hypothetical protein|uniref:Zinc-finger n=1 Tax=Granulicella pectinivorans TaxID=474950 RepID=A0A1I6M5E7_9BACT|nr:hypothetical protein [Granulicella pectinivorans]SFS10742.1 hypothetical protein SAMN05421771_1840 [Granulicella pectinivorans]
MNCKTFQNELPELLLNPAAPSNAAAMAHMITCPPCEEEYTSLASTISAMDSWTAPEVSPYFDQKMAVLLREEQAEPKLGFFARLRDHLLFNTGRQFRPAVAGALALVLILGGGSYSSMMKMNQVSTPQVSATVEDLQILDKNATTIQQMDQFLQDDDSSDDKAPS